MSKDSLERGGAIEAAYSDLELPHHGNPFSKALTSSNKFWFKAGADWQEKEIQKAENPWVPIADIPEEWKDVDRLDCFHINMGRMPECAPSVIPTFGGITHVMLPPQPPKESE